MFRLREEMLTGLPPGTHPPFLSTAGRDRFDTDKTVYVLVVKKGAVLGCVRLNPTTAPHMLGECLRSRSKGPGLPVGPHLWECSRFVIDTARVTDRLEQYELRCRLGLGITTWCLDHRVRELLWLTHHTFFDRISAIFRTRALGSLAGGAEGERWIPAISEVDLFALGRLLDRFHMASEIVAGRVAAGVPEVAGHIA